MKEFIRWWKNKICHEYHPDFFSAFLHKVTILIILGLGALVIYCIVLLFTLVGWQVATTIFLLLLMSYIGIEYRKDNT